MGITIQLHNFGVYAGDNEFIFEGNKPVVLIGGMNGRGKTTFLEAVLLALYGSNSFAYSESKQRSYIQYLRSFVNRGSDDQTCSVELEFEINNEIKENYIVRREWDAVSKRTKEQILVYKDGTYNEFLTNNWPMFVENILPSALSSFFFFDGEKIAELAVDNTNIQLKNSIRSMLGISVLDVLSNDILRNLKKVDKIGSEKKSVEEIQVLREEKESAIEALTTIDAEIEKMNQKLIKDNDSLEALHAEKSNRKHIITTAIEHKAVLETVKHLESEGFDVDIVSPDLTGRVSEEKILEKVKDNTLLVSVMHVNNETGIIQPVKEIGEKLQERGILFHIDATQSCGKLVEEIRSIKYDMLSFSAHKLMGPQGVGVLVLRKKSYKFPPVKAILYGGQQERGIRPGTLPVALVAGCGKACEIAESEYQRNIKHSQDLKNELLTVLDESGIQYHFNGEQNYCVPSTLNICIDGVSSEALMISTKQFCGVSNGSACTSKSYSPSYVLVAMGIATEQIESSIRISWGPNTDKEDALHNFKALLEIAKQIKS